MERTLVILKPDAIQRGLIGPIITRLEQRGLTVCRHEADADQS